MKLPPCDHDECGPVRCQRAALPSLGAAPGSEFRVRPLQLWTFPDLKNGWEGIWETVGVTDPGTNKELWSMRKVTGERATKNKIPAWLILETGRCHKLVTIYPQNAKLSDEPTKNQKG